jgi:hypothetical protein
MRELTLITNLNSQKFDNDLVQQLCQAEFGLSVDVLTSKRKGKSTSNQPRHLLTYVRSGDQAQTIIRIARQLRKSADPAVHAHVFINPNLTKAEAKAQFEIRQQRRATRPTQKRQPSVMNDTNLSAATATGAVFDVTADEWYPVSTNNITTNLPPTTAASCQPPVRHD